MKASCTIGLQLGDEARHLLVLAAHLGRSARHVGLQHGHIVVLQGTQGVLHLCTNAAAIQWLARMLWHPLLQSSMWSNTGKTLAANCPFACGSDMQWGLQRMHKCSTFHGLGLYNQLASTLQKVGPSRASGLEAYHRARWRCFSACMIGLSAHHGLQSRRIELLEVHRALLRP